METPGSPSAAARLDDRSIPRFLPRAGVAWALAAAFLLGAWVLALAVNRLHGHPFALDSGWMRRMLDVRDPPVTAAADVLNLLGLAPASWVIRGGLTLWLFGSRRRWAALAFALTWLGAAVTSSAVKAIVDRPRPPASLGLVPVGSASFPSGHVLSMASTTLVLVLVLVAPGRRSWWLVVACAATLAMGWSRTYLGVHWLTDTVAGALLGWGVALVATLATEVLRDRRRASDRSARRSVVPPP
jgi:membrane-associated phospholipid phosphatase